MLRLALPVMVSRAGILTMFTVDTLFTGWAGADELAFLGLGMAALTVFMLMSIGLLQGVIVLTAQAMGAGHTHEAGTAWRAGLVHAAVLGAFVSIPSLFAEPLLMLLGQDPHVVAGAGPVARQFAWGLVGMLFYICTTYFLEGIGRPRVGMTIMVALNLLNIPLDATIAAGWGGWVSPTGAWGAVMTTSVLRWLGFAAAFAYVLTQVDRKRYGLDAPFLDAARTLGPRLRRIGAPFAAAQGLESGAYATIVFMAGALGAASLAAHQVTMNLVSITFMAAVGLSAATSVRVGRAVGAEDGTALAAAGWTGITLALGALVPLAIFFALVPQSLASVFIPESPALTIAEHTVRVAAFIVIFSGTMAVAMGALRGAGDAHTPMGAYGLAFWCVAIPCAYICAFPAGLGAPGLTLGIAAGVAAGLTLLCLRFAVIARRPPKRV